MLIKIDYRENNLLATMNLLFKEHSHEIQHGNLPLGDIILVDDSTTIEKVIIERKTLYDLAASIKDGRYNEQSFRLNNVSLPNHNIIYLIEGDFEKYNAVKGRVDKKTLTKRVNLLYISLINYNANLRNTRIICQKISKFRKH